MKLKLISRILGVTILTSSIIFSTRAFLWAFLNNGRNYTMHIDKFGEAIPEFIIVLVLFPFGFYVIYKEIKSICFEVKN